MTPRTILIATDFSEQAEKATTYGLELARAFGARVHLVHTWAVSFVSSADLPTAVPATFIDDVAKGAQQALDEALKRHQAAGVTLTGAAAYGDARDVVVDTARQMGADLIIVGTHGRRGVRRALLGSVAESVVRHAPCPVLVVR
ncbi:MAG: universal stress protein [Archangium sp.]|nr:universal stress protein [Archangium sp.]